MITLKKYLQARIEKRGPDECWPWKLSCMTAGYGQSKWERKKEGAHRLTWQAFRGPIPPGKQILHTCDFRPCCNPRHLFAGTNKENVKDKIKKGRQAKGSANASSKLTEDQVKQIFIDSRTLATIARSYLVAPQTIRAIKIGQTWKHLDFDCSNYVARGRSTPYPRESRNSQL